MTQPSDLHPFSFSETELQDPVRFASRLCHAQDATSRLVRELFGEPTRQQLEAYLSAGDSEGLKTMLVETLNGLLSSPTLSHASASEKSVPLGAASEPESRDSYASVADLARRNRLLLQQLYPDEVAACREGLENAPHDGAVVGNRNVSIGGSATNTVIVTGSENIITYGGDKFHSLSEFEMREAEQAEVRASFVAPVGLAEFERSMESRQLVWIIGPPEAGKSTLALYLAQSNRRFHSVYKIQGTRAWSIISGSRVDDSVVVLVDAVYLAGKSGESEAAPAELAAMDELDMDDELDSAADLASGAAVPEPVNVEEVENDEARQAAHPVQELLDCGNTVIITSTAEVYAKVRDSLKSYAFGFSDALLITLSAESYGRAQRLELIKKAAHEKGLSGEVKKWALLACDKLARESERSDAHPIFREWLPGEIGSFVNSVLAGANSSDEVEAELKVPLNKRVYSWFMQLNNESTRFFVLVRAMFPNLEENELHGKMEEIVNKLKKTYSLALVPLSIYGYRATPYISDSPPYRFINAHVFRATTDVVAEYYHQPFAELSPLLKSWSVPDELQASGEGPPGGENRRRQEQLLRETAPLRDAVARMAGRVGRYNLASVKDLLNYWVAHRLQRIGMAAGVALRHAVMNEGNYEGAFSLVEEWAKNHVPDVGHFRRRSATDALWRLIAAAPDSPWCEQALRLLEYLARDTNPYIRRAVAHAVSQVVEHYEPARIKGVLELLARDPREEVRTYLATCLAVSIRCREEFQTVIKEWAGSDDRHLTVVAALYLLANWERKDEKLLLFRMVNERPALFEEAMRAGVRLMLRRKKGVLTFSTLRRVINGLAGADDDSCNRQAVVALCAISQGAVINKRLDIESQVKGLLRQWEGSQNDALRLAAAAFHFLAGRTPEARLALLKQKFASAAFAGGDLPRVQAARWLNWLASRERVVIHELLQDWLVVGDDKTVAAVVFYLLMAADDSELERYEYLEAIQRHFPLSFQRALELAVEDLPADSIIPALLRLAACERVSMRKQVALALGLMSTRDDDAVFRLLEDALAIGDANTGSTVVFFWIATEHYTEEQRQESLKNIRRSFPHTFDRGIREAVGIWGADCLESLGPELRQSSSPLLTGGGER